ncbi:MAG: endonuclease MutS2 [Firmicutes bacterium]|nr:endonuclease MutS2 [Bacillota bacterium]
MLEREIKLLEFDKIRLSLVEQCETAMGQELAEDLIPTAEIELCRRWQAETSEAVSLMKRYHLDLEPVTDIRRFLPLAARGGMLGEEQLWAVLRLLLAVTKVKVFFREKEGYPILQGLVKRLDPLPELRELLRQSLDDEGKLKSSASPELERLTRAINTGERNLRERFDRFVKNPSAQKYLQESLITMRGDRLVVPVRVEYRAQVPGVVHDQSASGATIFVEPLWAVETNNKLAVLRREAEKEKERILLNLSQKAGDAAEILNETLNLYAELDFILAKGRLSLKLKAVEPDLNDTGYIKLVNGRHPLLVGEVVPISLELGHHIKTLVITGPNTGGKTVTLKTVGLFAMLAQSGLHIPADEGTELAVFPQIFADIGDEQSISQSLSTFSGHMKNIIEILENLNGGALVLLDEIGAGTDPTEGAGLAMAILEYLHQNKAITIATTHYSQLKTFAYITPGMENASVEFDVATLRPTYQLLVGVPGVSNAFAIAKRLGLSEEIIARGREFLTREEKNLEELVADLVADRKRLEYVSRQAEDERRQAQSLLLQVKEEKAELERRKEEILAKARNEALEVVVRAKREAQQILKELRKMRYSEAKPSGEEVEALGRSMEDLVEEVHALAAPPAEQTELKPEDLTGGREVMVRSLGQRGTIVEVSGKTVQVQIGPMRVTVEVDDLAPVAEPEKKEKTPRRVTTLYVAKNVSRELDLRGLTLDEAILKVDMYLDEAAVSSLKEVRLIHGKGTGRLRAGLRQHLHKHPRVASQRLGHPAEGGTGVTVVELK